jgi:hypothetical protein
MRLPQFHLSLLAVLTFAGLGSSQEKNGQNGICVDNNIRWGPCDFDILGVPIPFECGKMMAPLDYTNKESDKMVDIQILRLKATKQPSKGSIFFNFGGPGAAGIDEFGAFQARLIAYVGSN